MSSDAAAAADPRDGHVPGGAAPLESFKYDDAISRMFMTATVVWALVATLAGLIVAFQLVLPVAVEWLELKWGAGGLTATLRLLYEQEFLSFGRLRPLHTNAAIFAFAGNAIFAAIYYSTQRLCKTRMYSDLLGRLHFWGWQLIIVAAAVTLPLGITQSKEYAELEWPIDLAIAVVWVGFFGVNFFMTLARRRERHMYVALWFYIATIITVAMLHVFNNLWLPVGLVHLFQTGEMPSAELLLKSYPVYAGVQDALMQWWYGHNAVAFFLTTPFLGLMYYFLPKAAQRPVFSYRLSIVHFWSLVFIYIWAGPHHLHYTALPQWACTLGMLFSVMLWMPSWGGMINGLMTLRGAWDRVAADPILKFFVVGVTFYGMSTFEGPFLSIKSVNSLSHYTDWTIGHVHGGTLGWVGFMSFGMMYWLMPRLYQTPVWSKKLMEWHFWLGTLGVFAYWLSMQWAGITQGLMWRAMGEAGGLAYPDFVETVTKLFPMYWIRAAGGAMYLVGVLMMGVNYFMTWRNRPERYEETVHKAPALTPVVIPSAEEFVPASKLETVVGAGRWLDRGFQMFWHRRWERLPVRFTVFVLVAVGSASVLSTVPLFVAKSNIPTISTVRPYTPLELAGRDIYLAEGCYNCHSQMIRPIWAETMRYGEYSKPGEFVYDHPFQWGSRRIGPDLQRVGGKYSHDWHVRHMENPRQLVQGSIMPTYAHLLEQEIDWAQIERSVRAMKAIGVPYDEEVGRAAGLAREQASRIASELVEQGGYEGLESKKMIALVAYLQRLGTDLTASAEE